MKTKYIVLAFLTAALALSSCSKLLDIPRKGVIDYDTFYKTDDEIESANITMYSDVRGWYYNVMLVKNILSDDYFSGGASRGDNAQMDALGDFAFNSESSQIEGSFSGYYGLIYHANVILGHIDPEQSKAAARAVAEAHLFRGWAYFELTTLWGNPPIVDHELVPSEYAQANGSTEDLWALVESDLLYAINSGVLAEKSSLNDATQWRVTKQYAQALLGKAYIWMASELKDNGYYQKAADQLNAVVGSNLYDLFTDGPYGDMRNPEYKMNCEDLFESIRVNDLDNQGDNFDFYGAMVSWRASSGEMTIPEDVAGAGWGFMVPTEELLATFEAVEGKNSYRRLQTLKTYDELKAMGVQWNMPTLSTGIYNWKGRFLSEELSYYGMINTKNPLWMRFAEVLLLGAEANLQAGHPDVALTYVNRVRSRAQLPALNGVTLNDIKNEKRCELCGEGVRFQDILRWGDAYDLLKETGKVYPLMQANGSVEYVSTGRSIYGFKQGKHEHLPYPYTETMLNKNCKQNPNY
ncbi:MAG: RagB/SusD family nutrient uptake outer membrane protein [Bacteroidales bacterium]|nr:RagB/SusD family nutrient uptake outer membrane protein [Bacteroidales bacterium]